MKKISVIVLRAAGTNCDQETQFAFEQFGANVDRVHINQLVSGRKQLKDYHILAVPGGFSYGDDIASGKILANELRLRLTDDLQRFRDAKKPIIGICNGFQILTKAGILPGKIDARGNFEQTVTLTHNDSSRFEDRWVHLHPTGKCVWTEGIEQPIYLPVAHGEGKFVPKDEATLELLKENEQIVARYCNEEGKAPEYPQNPNGSVDNIAGICDESGIIFGLMPHPERHFWATQHPSWTRRESAGSKHGDGAKIFENGVRYVREKLL